MSLYTRVPISLDTIRLYNRWVAVEEDLDMHVAPSGLATNVNRKATTVGRVLGVGVKVGEDLRVGDTILYVEWQGGRWDIGDQRCLIMDIADVLVVLERKA